MVGMRPYTNNYNYQQQNTIQLTDDKQIVEHLEKIFSEENLNKDLYLRNRINNGKILIEDLARHYDFKLNNINQVK